MKLILQHGAQQVEYEFTGRNDSPLTTQQATKIIHYSYQKWKNVLDEPPESPTVAVQAELLLRMIADYMMSTARRQLSEELRIATEDQVQSELG